LDLAQEAAGEGGVRVGAEEDAELLFGFFKETSVCVK